TELVETVGGEIQRIRRGFLLVLALPQDRGTAFRRDHRVGAVLEHDEAIADTDSQRSTGAALTRDDCYDRHAQDAHLEYVACDRLTLAALFGTDTGVRALRVDECDERQT